MRTRGLTAVAAVVAAAAAAFVAPGVAGSASHTPPRKTSPPYDHRRPYRPPPGQWEISTVINGNGGSIKMCYQRALLRDKTLADGRVTLKLIIGMSGMVKHVRAEGAPQFRQLEPCLREIVQRWVFPPASGQYGAELPLIFRAGDLEDVKGQGVRVRETCSMTVKTVPWSELWIDGKDTGVTTPVTDHKLPCGKHKLVFKRPDLRIHHTELMTLRPGQRLDVSYKLATVE
jgi:hypothetical protein